LLDKPVVADMIQPNAGQNTLLFSISRAILQSAASIHQT